MDTKHIVKRQFFGRFNRMNFILFSMAVFVLLFWIFSLKQSRIDRDFSRLNHLFAIQVNRIDSRLQKISDTVEALRNHAEMRFADKKIDTSFIQTENPSGGEWKNVSEDIFLQNNDDQFQNDINMAYNLNTLFAFSFQTLKTMPQVYYTTHKWLIRIYPKISAQESGYSENILKYDFYHMGIPEKNPERSVFWTGMQEEKDRMIACAAPVYDNQVFKGTVAMTVSAEMLNRQIGVFEPEKGNMFILNEQNQLIACPHFLDSRNNNLCDIVRNSISNTGTEAGLVVKQIKGYTLILKRLKCAPWTAVFLMPQPSGFAVFTNRITLNILILLPCGLLLTLLAIRHTRTFFMHPAEMLLAFHSSIYGPLTDRFRKMSEERTLRDMFRK